MRNSIVALNGDLRLKIKVNPGLLADQVMKSSLYDAYTDALLDLAQEFQDNSPIGASRMLVEGWDVQNSPKRVAWGFEVKSNITNSAGNARNRIGGRPGGTPPPIQPLTDWVMAKGIAANPNKARGIAFAIRRKIANEGTERFKAKDNWVGIDHLGKRIPGGRLEEAEKAIAQKLSNFTS